MIKPTSIFRQTLALLSLFTLNMALADTPIFLFQSYAGNVDFVGAQSTRRTEPNTVDSCAVLGVNTTNNATISGIPLGATIRAAHLYWAGSYSTEGTSTQTTPDFNVTFEGGAITADRQYTSQYDPTEEYFNGAKDVTTQVQARANPNGSYSFSGLSVNTAAPHCTFDTVMAGWALVIVYEDPAEDFRVVNLFEGFQLFRGSSITLTPSNFKVPTSPINGKHAYLTWEGDEGNSGRLNNLRERLRFNGTILSDATNPNRNQFNSKSTINGIDNNSHGVDYDLYTIDSLLSAGDTSATSVYSSGADQVHLSMEIISITNTPVSDLAITKTHSGNFAVGENGTYTISVINNGPIAESGPIVVTDTLPAGLTYVSATGTDWSCSAIGQDVTCTRTGSLANGASASDITLTVAVSSAAAPSVINTANVSGNNFDNISGNDTSDDPTAVISAPIITFQKASAVVSDLSNGTTNPKRIPGAVVEYTITVTNSGFGVVDENSILIDDAIPTNTDFIINSVQFSVLSSGLTSANISYSIDGSNYNSTQSTATSHIRVAPQGTFSAATVAVNPSFQVKFQVQIE